MHHPILTLATLANTLGWACFIAMGEAAQANPNLAAVATIMGAAATIFSGWVAWRHPLRKSRPKKGRKPRVNSDASQNQTK